jgi:hypothetical protein
MSSRPWQQKELNGQVHALATLPPRKYTSVTVSITLNLDIAVERKSPFHSHELNFTE